MLQPDILLSTANYICINFQASFKDGSNLNIIDR